MEDNFNKDNPLKFEDNIKSECLNNSLISVIIPIDNSEKYLSRCLESIVTQTFQNFEIICINNNSSDNSLSVLQEYMDDFNIEIINVVNKSINELRNIGLNHSKGEYILFMNPEDWLDLDAFDLLFKKINNCNFDICMFPIIGCDESSFHENGYYDFAGFDEELKNSIFDYRDIMDILFLLPTTPCNKLYKFDFLKEANACFSSDTCFDESLFFFKTVLSAKNICYVDEKFYCKFKNNFNNSKILKEIVNYSNSLIELFKEFNIYNYCFNELFNYKIGIIRFWYFLVEEKERDDSFNFIKSDFKLLEKLNNFSSLKNSLSNSNLIFFNRIMDSSNIFEFKNIQFKSRINGLTESTNDLNSKIERLKSQNHELQSKNEKLLMHIKKTHIREDLFRKKSKFSR